MLSQDLLCCLGWTLSLWPDTIICDESFYGRMYLRLSDKRRVLCLS